MFLGVGAVFLTLGLTVEGAKVPQYFQTSPELFPGPTATGKAPFLAQINPEFDGPDGSFVPNTPLQTAEPIVGDADGTNFFKLQGIYSPYYPNPRGFGVDEYPLPSGAKIGQVHMIHRHGSRYPATNATQARFGKALAQAIKSGAKFSGKLSFLNTWTYDLGAEELVSFGRQELYDSGVLHYIDYGHLYDTSSKIIVRSTTQDRMLKSAENWLAGFFGLEWPKNATLELLIEADGFNNSLAGERACKNANTGVATGGTNASAIWQKHYLADAVKRLQASTISGFTWNISDAYNAQLLCSFETVDLGYSNFCDLFTLTEWKGYEYAFALQLTGNNLFQSPTGRAVGIGYVEEFLARLERRYIFTSDTQVNTTLDNNPTTFPLDQTLYFDFSHVATISGVLTAFGITQFAQSLPTSGPPPNRQFVASYIQPAAGRLDIEIISTPHPVSAHRSKDGNVYLAGGPTKYVHFIIDQRTLPLGVSLSACGKRDDGWCELHTFLKTQRRAVEKAQFDYACNGDYPPVPYGSIKDGVPLPTY